MNESWRKFVNEKNEKLQTEKNNLSIPVPTETVHRPEINMNRRHLQLEIHHLATCMNPNTVLIDVTTDTNDTIGVILTILVRENETEREGEEEVGKIHQDEDGAEAEAVATVLMPNEEGLEVMTVHGLVPVPVPVRGPYQGKEIEIPAEEEEKANETRNLKFDNPPDHTVANDHYPTVKPTRKENERQRVHLFLVLTNPRHRLDLELVLVLVHHQTLHPVVVINPQNPVLGHTLLPVPVLGPGRDPGQTQTQIPNHRTPLLLHHLQHPEKGTTTTKKKVAAE